MNDQELQKSRYLHFFRAIAQGPDNKAEFVLCGNTCVKGCIMATDSQNNRFLVRDLETPTGLYEKAVLRGTDVELIEIPQRDWLIG
ncbi:hypothetical protein BJV82DRAFT_596327 [Fennellomyces sp. T-0311]|nr:hypothetical protein BJV82DRAFT_596327 [Fennellomyces sp. T-0311]